MPEIVTRKYQLTSQKDIIDFAAQLKKIIVEQKLYSNIQGRNFIHSEGWQFCGMSFGIIAIVESLEDLSTDTAVKYRAEVVLKNLTTNKICGRGIAICTNKERGKQQFEEYAIASMAQTRAVSKAYRSVFGFIAKLAGYEATPAEEVEGVYNASENKKTEIVNYHS